MNERVRLIGPKVYKSQFLNGLRPFMQFSWDTTFFDMTTIYHV